MIQQTGGEEGAACLVTIYMLYMYKKYLSKFIENGRIKIHQIM